MNKTYSNPCIRCGTERVVLKVWKEVVGTSTVITTEKVCPNPECQKEVNKDNKKQSDKRNAIKQRSEQRAIDRKVIKDAERAKKKKPKSR